MNMSINEAWGDDPAAGVESCFRRLSTVPLPSSVIRSSSIITVVGSEIDPVSTSSISRVGDRVDVQIEIHLVSPSLDPNRMMGLD
jgi:hypothetical protein